MKEYEVKLARTEESMLRWMCNFKLKEVKRDTQV